MFQKASVPPGPVSDFDQPSGFTPWGLRRRAPQREDVPAPSTAPAEEPEFIPDQPSYGFENFGRSGLELGGLHRDQQWVGAWGGRC